MVFILISPIPLSPTIPGIAPPERGPGHASEKDIPTPP